MIAPGDRFGRLTVVETGLWWQGYNRRRRAARCECECGQRPLVICHNLRVGNSRSCGCTRVGDTVSESAREGFRRGGQRSAGRAKTRTGGD